MIIIGINYLYVNEYVPFYFLQWNINESPPTKDVMTLTFGLLLNPEAAMSMVDKGPSADSPEVSNNVYY